MNYIKKHRLTKEEGVQLLDMCNGLFPDYVWWRSKEAGEEEYLYYQTRLRDIKYMHWMEFCIFYLGHAVFDRPMYNRSVYKQWFFDRIRNNDLKHPVLYLYTFYKKTIKHSTSHD